MAVHVAIREQADKVHRAAVLAALCYRAPDFGLEYLAVLQRVVDPLGALGHYTARAQVAHHGADVAAAFAQPLPKP